MLTAQAPAPAPPKAMPPKGQPPIVPKAEELKLIESKVNQLETMLKLLAGKDAALVTDVEVYAKAGRFLLEFPPTFFTQAGIDQAMAVLDQGLAKARELQSNTASWATAKGRKIHAYRSALDGSVQPYGVTVPDSYDGTRPVRLYVWLHGRDQTLTESSFIYKFPNASKSLTYSTADLGQITLDCYGRWNNANHWAGEVDVFEAIADVSRRYKIDAKRIILRGFSLGGAGAWHIALQYPDRFAAAEIGAGTYPRRSQMPGFPPYQAGPLRIWENILDWSLNAFNIPIAGHDGDTDTQVASIPPDRETPSRGQLESSLRVRAQLAREGFPSEGEENNWRVKGTSNIFLISEKTGHGVSPLVRQRLDAFLKEHGDRGIVSPDEVRFVTYTTRYPRAHWVSVDGLGKHYERADVRARRDAGRRNYEITTNNVTHLELREMNAANQLKIDGQTLRVKPGAQLYLSKAAGGWRASPTQANGLRKRHALQGPIDDAFLEPFLLVRPTGVPWNAAAHEQALRMLARFDRVYARYYRAHPRIKDDKDVTPADFANFHVALFGDPGSNRWIGKMRAKLPIQWSRETLRVNTRTFVAAEHIPALIYPNPLNAKRYVVINSGLTIDEREYHGDYSMPRLGDLAILKVQAGAESPDVAFATLLDEFWRLPE
jgi:pimeloyl-ACP methyl ester carboxylesterase